MPWNRVMGKFKSGTLHSGSKKGRKVTNPKQAVAIMLSEKREAENKPEYRAHYGGELKDLTEGPDNG